MYDFITDLIGEVPSEFTFVYSILTVAMGILLLCFLFQLFYLPLKLIEGR